MGVLRLTVVVLATALVCAAPAHARQSIARPPVTWLKGEGNYRKAHRPPTAIDRVVVHVTEGPFWSSIRWLKNHHAHASAHYVVSRSGAIVQLVHQSDVAWHAGNRRVNERSVGIEHEGMTFDPAGFTTAQYRASARLAAWIARRSLMPVDREHLIGHVEVPDPSDPSSFGGAGRHQDPGPYWRWNRYLRLVRKFAFPPKPLRVQSSLTPARSLRGIVPWSVRASANVRRVDFVMNGRVLWSDRRRPFSFLRGRGLNTVRLDNGGHRFEVRAYGQGRVKRVPLPVVVRNERFALTHAGAREWTVARGVVRLRARVRAAKAETVSLRVDGRRVALDRRPPYVFRWDSRRAAPGRHVLLITARAVDGRVARRRIPLVVNAPERVHVRGQTPDGSEPVTAFVVWRVDAVAADRVEFWIDGVLRGADVAAPFTFGWNAPAEAPGEHRLEARATSPGGKTVSSARTVVVAPAPGP